MRALFEKKCQAALNHYLALDPESQLRLKKCAGKSVRIELSGTPLVFQLDFKETHIQLTTDEFLPYDTLIKGTPLSLTHLSLSKNRQPFFNQGDVLIEGDLELGHEVIELFDQLDIDFEEYASHYLGDILANKLGRLVRSIKKTGKQVKNSFIQNVDEYLHEEIRVAPGGIELADFFEKVDTLRMDIDRLAAKIEELTKEDKEQTKGIL